MQPNFRKFYYKSLGVQTIQAKLSVENVFGDKVLDTENLRKLCLWVRIPHSDRVSVWKVLLGVLPLAKEAWSDVNEQRQSQFEALWTAERLLFSSTSESLRQPVLDPDAQATNLDAAAHKIHRMLRLYMAAHSRSLSPWMQIPALSDQFVHVARALLEICDLSCMDAFWLLKGFWKGLEGETTKESIDNHVAVLNSLLKTHCEPLHLHLEIMGGDFADIYECWFGTLFACIIPSQPLESIWDIVVGGASAVFPYIALELLLSVKTRLLSCRDAAEMVAIVKDIENVADMDSVVNTAIGHWEKPILATMSKDNRRIIGY
ncbi:uncharacterized protein BJ171DRAFT_582255 [Polychytrium aggregatum]|uniref:uncharacterized protein n=1 Tax=Polychytrium aggregatum TaxID=110093 RepID=UPI0022FE13C9|nr:uncharacterized protein BJ171DRAFT_582255 [Polychytrium aggregatum]KAI9204279.1 hypothetical protein BJ171DRAFT_582255 [Polychytrium aggregatum]